MLTGEEIDNWEPPMTTERMLNDQVADLRYYLDIEHKKIADGQAQAKLLLKKISQCRRRICEIDREKMGK